MENIDFSKMEVGDRIAMTPGKWGEDQRKAFAAATEYHRLNPGVQFQVDGHDGSDFERGQHWIERIK